MGSFTNAGAFPFHTWIVNFTEKAHGISSAFMPASYDKLIGIYFLTVLCSRIFVLNQWLVFALLVIGVCTIIFAVMMALVQHNFKKLLGYHAVSQVGYMVVGISLGSPLGIAAGLFHMFNNAVYKNGLFLTATSVERKTGTADLDKTGGLAASMPISFIAALIFALSISGIPPLNGFASKWMIYQGIVEFGQQEGIASQLWIIWLSLAVFGSALTLASVIKFIAGIYLGNKKEIYSKVKEVSIVQWIPKVILALICILSGAFATNFVVKELFMPVSGEFACTGIWNSSLLFWLVVTSVIVGFLIYWLGSFKNMRKAESFVGG
jgi:formate hydrogenlyase subunit 3/multisubunit Na+/H+ antiporter MnhD subunit